VISSRPTAILAPSHARVAIALGLALCGPGLGPVEGAFREGGGRAALGPVAIQLAPFCNVLTLTAAPLGPVFLLTGSDDACGGEPAPVTGSAVVRTDGQVALGLILAGAAGANEIAGTVDPAALTGTWRDSGGRSGSLAPAPAPPAPGQPRPTDLPPLEATVARAAGYLLQCPGDCSPRPTDRPPPEVDVIATASVRALRDQTNFAGTGAGYSLTCFDNSTPCTGSFPLLLPGGARLSRVELDVCDTTVSGVAAITIQREPRFGNGSIVATAQTVGAPCCGILAAVLASPEVIDPAAYYTILVELNLAGGVQGSVLAHAIRVFHTSVE
jgi:hypothetical protein